ncbi:MAG TPA: hypothetical protein PKX04_06155 [Chitinophagales bacterium]|nr:hypothetical protein [Chitinophagales bacterium]MCB9020302.1 hypothetical protein [Chitinophagales bacterium]HPE97520.1 hypothetical protein [Chitinophagales bacterium]HQU38813.1 hypothetical protein [Chitinophagales bacterium]HQU76258.1 hypothetical protein [Chitinophagales bacterium]
MKNLITASLLLITHTVAFADVTLSERLEKPLYVVLSNDNVTINQELREAFDNNWVLNEVNYITEDEYEPLSWTEENCFLIYQKNQQIDGEGNTVFSEVIRIVAFTKKGKLVENIAGTPVFNSIEPHEADLVSSLRILQDKVRFELYREQGETEFSSYSEKIQQSSGIVQLKKLYISAQDLEQGMDYASISDIYEGEVRIVDRSYIEQLIEQKASDAVYVLIDHMQTSGISYLSTKTIMDAETGTVLYKDSDTALSPRGFGKRDFKKLAD